MVRKAQCRVTLPVTASRDRVGTAGRRRCSGGLREDSTGCTGPCGGEQEGDRKRPLGLMCVPRFDQIQTDFKGVTHRIRLPQSTGDRGARAGFTVPTTDYRPVRIILLRLQRLHVLELPKQQQIVSPKGTHLQFPPRTWTCRVPVISLVEHHRRAARACRHVRASMELHGDGGWNLGSLSLSLFPFPFFLPTIRRRTSYVT